MPSNNAGRELFRDLSQGRTLSPIYMIYGEETFLVDQAVSALVKAVLPDGGDDFSHQFFDGSMVSGQTVVQSLETLGLFGGRRLVRLVRVSSMSAEELGHLTPYLENPAPDTFLLLTDRAVDARKRFFKKLKASKASTWVEFKPLYRNELAGWVQRRAGLKGLDGFTSGMAELVVELTGPGLAAMESALDKLSLFRVGRSDRLTSEQLNECLDDTRSRNVFELTRLLGERNLDGSFLTLHRMLDAGQSAVGMVTMIARHFRIVWQVKAGQREGLSGRALSKVAGCPPMFLREYERDARRFSDSKLGQIVCAIHDAERSLKSSRLDDSLILDSLVMQVCNQ